MHDSAGKAIILVKQKAGHPDFSGPTFGEARRDMLMDTGPCPGLSDDSPDKPDEDADPVTDAGHPDMEKVAQVLTELRDTSAELAGKLAEALGLPAPDTGTTPDTGQERELE